MSAGLIAWFTGLSGSGKSTIARSAQDLLTGRGFSVETVDGDTLRRNLARPLGFSTDDVTVSNDLAIQVCSDLRQNCDVVLVSRISPLRRAREIARQTLGEGFIEVYVKASTEAVAQRDPKGLYERARTGGDIPIGMPGGLVFEVPADPDLVLDTDQCDQQALAQTLTDFIQSWIRHGKPGL